LFLLRLRASHTLVLRRVCAMLALMAVPAIGGVGASVPAQDVDGAPLVMQVSLVGIPSAPTAGWAAASSRAGVPAGGMSAGRSLVQSLKVSPGTLYEVSLLLAASDNHRAPPSVVVQAGGIRHQLIGKPGADRSRVAFRFQAPRTGQAELRIEAMSGAVLLDEVQVHPVSDAGSLPLLIGGLISIGWLLNRRRPSPLIPSLRVG
jgi:hypothetical protein